MEDLMFNFEDMNISEESLDFINEANGTPKEEVKEETKETQTTVTPGVEIDETSGEVKETITESEEEAKADESTSQEETPSSDEHSSHDSTLYALAQYLKEEGVLFVEDELKEVKGLDDLKALIEKSNEQARYAKLNESQRRYQEALENGIPTSDFEKLEKEIQTFTGITEEAVEEDQNLRYEILAIDFMNQGIDQEKALKLAKFAMADETNVQDAKEALKNIVESKKASFKELVEKSKTEKEASIKEIQENLFAREKLLDNKLNDITKNKLFDMITTQVDHDDKGRPINKLQKWQLENPVESSILMNYMFMMTNEGKDLSLIQKSATSTAAKELERKLKNLSFDKDGALLLPDHMMRKQPSNDQNKDKPNRNNLTINI